MNDQIFDAFVRRAADHLDRRSMLGLFGGMMLAGIELATAPALTMAGKDHGHGSGGSGKHGKGGKKGGKGGKKKKKSTKCSAAHTEGQKDCEKLNPEECEENYGTCTDYWANYCTAFYTGDLRVHCQASFISCCADLLTCTDQANARHVECVTLMDQVW